MSGEKSSPQSEYIQKRLGEVTQQSEETLGKVGLRGFMYNPQVDEALSLTKEQLRALSAEQCGEYSYLLSGYSLYVQRCINEATMRMNWCEGSIKKLLAKEYNNYNKPGDFTPFEMKLKIFCINNTYAIELDEELKACKIKIDTLNGLAYNIKFMSESLMELQRSKRRFVQQ